MTEFQERLYLIFTGIFIASLVACNLIFQKFFTWNFLGITFELSVGIIAYPVTFIVTDLISELYGKRRANQVVLAGFFASIFTTLLVMVAINATTVGWSPIDSETFNRVFGLTGPAFFASMVAYLTAQLIDVRIFHFWKRLTKGKYLWLRNNASTMFSQLVDTSVILIILCSFKGPFMIEFNSLSIENLELIKSTLNSDSEYSHILDKLPEEIEFEKISRENPLRLAHKFSSKDKANNLFSKLSIEESSVIQVSVLDWKDFYSLLWMGWLFKVIVALIDTPIIYFLLWVLKDKIRPASYLEE
tara:strand:+ start:125 stop:1030 length:906 start_codon:yes stop_codon:yes gene_type:complete